MDTTADGDVEEEKKKKNEGGVICNQRIFCWARVLRIDRKSCRGRVPTLSMWKLQVSDRM